MAIAKHLWACILGASVAGGSVARAGVTITPLPDAPASADPSSPTSTAPVSGDAGPAGNAPITADEAKSLFDAGKYKDALRMLARLLDLRGPGATFDRQKVLILRAECQLQIHEVTSALASLDLARSEADAAGSVDDASAAMALRFLIQKSANARYTPVTGPDHTPISILDKDKRAAAFTALFNDSLAAAKQKIQAATLNQTLPPLADLARDLPFVRALESAATNGTTATDALTKEGEKTASKVVNTALTDFESRVNRITTNANRMVIDNANSNGFGVRMRHQGLSAEDAQTLKEIGQSCEKLLPTLNDFAKAFNAVETFAPAKLRTQRIEDNARTALMRDYRLG